MQAKCLWDVHDPFRVKINCAMYVNVKELDKVCQELCTINLDLFGETNDSHFGWYSVSEKHYFSVLTLHVANCCVYSFYEIGPRCDAGAATSTELSACIIRKDKI